MDAHKKQRQRDALELASGYSERFRTVEVAAIAVFFLLLAGLAYQLWDPTRRSPWLVLSAVLLGYLAADFVSGFVHWLGDTWGSPEWLIIGESLIRPFREHHVDQEAITRHDFVETNGSNCLISIPVAVGALIIRLRGDDDLSIFAVSFLGSLIFWVFATNQFHKWAHLRHPPPVVAWLQRLHLVLPPEHHAIHHAAPFSRYYCITVGWLNWPLTKLRFFVALERLISMLTGALPRHDDIGELAAREATSALDSETPAAMAQKAHLPALHRAAAFPGNAQPPPRTSRENR
jgi:ubiquitin-conjugating enzyme E2 variant